MSSGSTVQLARNNRWFHLPEYLISKPFGFFFTSGQQPMPDRELPCTAPWLFELTPQWGPEIRLGAHIFGVP